MCICQGKNHCLTTTQSSNEVFWWHLVPCGLTFVWFQTVEFIQFRTAPVLPLIFLLAFIFPIVLNPDHWHTSVFTHFSLYRVRHFCLVHFRSESHLVWSFPTGLLPITSLSGILSACQISQKVSKTILLLERAPECLWMKSQALVRQWFICMIH